MVRIWKNLAKTWLYIFNSETAKVNFRFSFAFFLQLLNYYHLTIIAILLQFKL